MNEYKYRIPLFGPNYSNSRIVRIIRPNTDSDDDNDDQVTMANDICLLELGAEVDTDSGLVDVTDIITEEPELGTRCSAADWEGGDGNSLYKVCGS